MLIETLYEHDKRCIHLSNASTQSHHGIKIGIIIKKKRTPPGVLRSNETRETVAIVEEKEDQLLISLSSLLRMPSENLFVAPSSIISIQWDITA